MKAGQDAHKRAVYVNGIYCESMAEGARQASKTMLREIKLWEIQRMINGQKQISGLDVSVFPKPVEKPAQQQKKVLPKKKIIKPLLRYPPGEWPLDRGLEHWK